MCNIFHSKILNSKVSGEVTDVLGQSRQNNVSLERSLYCALLYNHTEIKMKGLTRETDHLCDKLSYLR